MSRHAKALSLDFAERVLQLADRRLAERRRVRCLSGAALLSIMALAAVSWIDFSAARRPLLRTPDFLLSPQPLASAKSASSSVDALSWVFPDAEPLDRFAVEDSSSENAASAASLFEDED